MEPASFAASLLTLLGAAGATCEFVYNFILDIKQVPDEMHSQAIKLRCLHQTLSSLVSIYERKDQLPELQLDRDLEDNIRNFLGDIQVIEEKIKRTSTRLDGSRTRQFRERLVWLSSDRRLRKFYDSLDTWIKIFSAVVYKTNLELLVKISSQTTALQSTLPSVGSECQVYPNAFLFSEGGKCNNFGELYQIKPCTNKQQMLGTKNDISKPTAQIPKGLSLYLSQKIDLVGLRVQRWGIIAFGEWSADFRVGTAMVRRWSENGKAIYKVMSWKEGVCLSWTLRTNRLISRRITLIISGIVRAPSLIASCNLTIRGVLQVKSPAYSACQNGDWLNLRKLLQNRSVNITDSTGYGDTFLHIAARFNHYDIVSNLLQAGAAVDAENDFGETPLQVAIKKNCDNAVSSSLISHGADLSHQDVTGRTPLHTFRNEATRNVIEYHQEDVDNTSLDSHGMNIAQFVSWSKSSLPIDLIRCCAGDIGSLETVDDKGRTVLHFACWRGNLKLMEYLLKEGTRQMMHPDFQGRTLLHYATESGRSAQAIDMLVCRGANVRVVDHQGNTVLHHAASVGNVEAVEKLLKIGAMGDVYSLNSESRTPLQMAILCRRREVVEALKSLYGDAQVLLASEEMVSNTDYGGKNYGWWRCSIIIALWCSLVLGVWRIALGVYSLY